jgi:twitching motility protein PilI
MERRVVLINQRLLEASGIIVSRTLGLRNPDSFTREEGLDPSRPWVKGRYRDSNGAIWLELDIAVLAKNAAFLDVAIVRATSGAA